MTALPLAPVSRVQRSALKLPAGGRYVFTHCKQMQQYYQSVCERQQQALRRNQALQQDVRRAHTSAASGVDTSQLELLKVRHCLFLCV